METPPKPEDYHIITSENYDKVYYILLTLYNEGKISNETHKFLLHTMEDKADCGKLYMQFVASYDKKIVTVGGDSYRMEITKL